MYITTHGHTGAVLTATSVATLGIPLGLPVGLGAAFISHFFLDYIQEYPYDDFGKNGYGKLFKIQLPSFLVFGICLLWLYSSHDYVYMIAYILGYLAGNLPDFIDKKWLWHSARPPKKRFSCHNGNGIFKIGNFKLGYPTLINVTKAQNLTIQLVMTILIVVTTLFLL